MKTAILTAVTGFLLTCAVYARLGETPAQIEQRYGKARERSTAFGHDALLYRTTKFLITAFYSNGVVVAEYYLPDSADTLDASTINGLLDVQGQGSRWSEVKLSGPGTEGVDNWRRDDLRAVAMYHRQAHTLMICTPAFAKAFAEYSTDNAARENLKGF